MPSSAQPRHARGPSWRNFVAALSAVAAAAPALASALNFNPPVELAGAPVFDFASRYNSTDLFAERIAGAGRLHVVWAARDNLGQTVLQYRGEQTAGTSVFTAARQFAGGEAGVEVREPSVCVDRDRRVHFAWVRVDSTGASVRYRSLRDGTLSAEEEIIRPSTAAGRIWHPTIRAVPLDRDEPVSVMVAAQSWEDGSAPEVTSLPMRYKKGGYITWEPFPAPLPLPMPVPPLGPFYLQSYQFDMISSVGVEIHPQGAVLMRCMPTYGDPDRQYFRTLFISADGSQGFGTWAITQTDYEYSSPGDEQLVVQSTGTGAYDFVAHFVHTEAGGGLRQTHYTQISLLPGNRQALETRALGFETQWLGGLAIVPDDGVSYRFQRPLTLVASVGGLPAASQNTGGLSDEFQIMIPSPRRMTNFSAATPISAGGVVATTGMPKVACVIHKTLPRVRVLVSTPVALLLYNEEGLDQPAVVPTPTPQATPRPTATPTPVTPGPERVADVLVGRGSTPTGVEFQLGDANGDGVWDGGDVIRLDLESR